MQLQMKRILCSVSLHERAQRPQTHPSANGMFMNGSDSLNLQPTASILGRGARERRHADLVK